MPVLAYRREAHTVLDNVVMDMRLRKSMWHECGGCYKNGLRAQWDQWRRSSPHAKEHGHSETHMDHGALICMRTADTIGRSHFHSQFHSGPQSAERALCSFSPFLSSSAVFICLFVCLYFYPLYWWVIYAYAVLLITAFSSVALKSVPFYDSRQGWIYAAAAFLICALLTWPSELRKVKLNLLHKPKND